MQEKTPTVTMIDGEKPSETIIKQSNQQEIIYDEKGRKIVLKKPNVLRQYKLIEILGDVSKNEVYMLMVLPMLFIQSIDDAPVVINTKGELDALISRLDDEGVNAVVMAVRDKFGAKTDEEAEKEKIKK